ncbi:MAG TPA: hypothetical protein VM686_29850, partial [Polyangiaceae bacterium]|nr:hypothetical protein [Polyangiaceae bacterium]
MRGIRLFNEFASWRWAPTVALIGATLLYILFIMLVIPSEIGLPGMNTKFVPRSSHGASSSSPSSPFSFGGDSTPATINGAEHEPAPPPTSHHVMPPQGAPGNFGSRGFSPPLAREEAAP